MLILPFTSVDINQLDALQPGEWPDIKEPYRSYVAADFCYPCKIVSDGFIIAIGSLIIHNDVAWLGHIIVHPQNRKKGLGEMMTRHLVTLGQHKGCTTTYLVATDLGERVYLKVGFVTETEYPVYTDVSIHYDTNTADAVAEPYHKGFEVQLAAMDKRCSGEDRFFHLQQYLSDAIICHSSNNLQGYYIPRLGSGLIVAVSRQAGLALVAIHTQTPKYLVFPRENRILLEMMEQQGKQPVKSVKRMRLGVQRPNELTYMYNRIGGNLG